MGIIGYNCSECSHSLLSDFCTAFAAIFLMECELFAVILFATICGFGLLEGICDANSVLKYGLTVEFESVNCDPNVNNFPQFSDFDATGLVLNCKLLFNGVAFAVQSTDLNDKRVNVTLICY